MVERRRQMKPGNQRLGLCVICSTKVTDTGPTICLKCNKTTTVDRWLERTVAPVVLTIVDAKSDCCNADVQLFTKLTCSDPCHEELVMELENQFGIYKKIIDIHTSAAFKVPTRDIIERGLKFEDLHNYPRWPE